MEGRPPPRPASSHLQCSPPSQRTCSVPRFTGSHPQLVVPFPPRATHRCLKPLMQAMAPGDQFSPPHEHLHVSGAAFAATALVSGADARAAFALHTRAPSLAVSATPAFRGSAV